MISLLKPLLLGSSELRNLIFQRKDIYCLLEYFVKSFGTSFENLYQNDDKLRKIIDDYYNDLIIKIQEIVSGQPTELDFIPKDGSVTIKKLSQDVLNLISCNVTIDSEANILIDNISKKRYKLVPEEAEPTIQYGDVEITEFEYQTNISANGATESMLPTKLSFRQKKTIYNPDGSVNIEYVNGDKQTTGVIVEYDIENKPDWFNFFSDNGIIQILPNPTEQSTSAIIKAKVTWNDRTSEYKEFTITQQAGFVRFTPSSIDVDDTEHELITINISNSKGFTVDDVSTNVDWAEAILFADDKIQLNINANESSARTGNIIVTYNENKTKTISINQTGKTIVNKFYYGGASSVDEIPEDINEIPNSTENLTIKNWNVESTDKYKLIYFNLPNNYKIKQIENEVGDIIDFLGPKIVEDRVIYYTDPSNVYRPLSNKYTITITKK